MVLKVVDMRHSAAQAVAVSKPPEVMASPSQARSLVALYLAAGALPEEIDGAVAVQIELEEKAIAPTSYGEVASRVIRALGEYRARHQTYTVVEESNA